MKHKTLTILAIATFSVLSTGCVVSGAAKATGAVAKTAIGVTGYAAKTTVKVAGATAGAAINAAIPGDQSKPKIEMEKSETSAGKPVYVVKEKGAE